MGAVRGVRQTPICVSTLGGEREEFTCGDGGTAGWGQVKSLCTYGIYRGGCKAAVPVAETQGVNQLRV